MDTAIVDNIGFNHLIAVRHDDIGQRITQQVITNVAQVKGFIGVGRRVLNHHQRGIFICRYNAILRIGMNFIKQFDPRSRRNGQIQETFDHIKSCHSRFIGFQILTDFLCGLLRALLRHFQEGEYHKGEVSFKLFFRLLQLHLRGRYILSVKCFESADYGRHKFIFYLHIQVIILRAKIQKKETLKRLLS